MIAIKSKIVFLQHGITKDDLSYVHYNNAKFWLFITTTKREEYIEGYSSVTKELR